MPLPFRTSVQDSIRQREYGLSSLMPDIDDFSFDNAESSLTYFQDLLNSTNEDMGITKKGNLYDAIGGMAWGFTDMATAHLLRGSWAFDTGGRPLAEAVGGVDMASKAGQYASQTGEALGFLAPMSKVAKGIRWGIQGTKYGARTVAKTIQKDLGERLAQKGAVQYTSKSAAVKAGGRSPHKHFYEAVNDEYVKRWYNKSGPAKVDGFNQAFQKVADKNKFINSVRDNMGTSLQRMADARGVKLGKGVSDDITEIFSSYFTNPKQFPVSSVGEMFARKFGVENRLATAYSHMFEEAVTFATFEGILEAVDSWQQDRPYDIGVPKHAAGMGHILGAIRFIPGGKKFGGTMFGHGGGVTQFRAMMKALKPYKNRIDPRNDAHREGTFKLWSYLKDGHPFKNGNKTGDVLTDFAERHPLWKAGTFEGIKKTSINTASTSNIHTILNEGSKKQKEAMGVVMRDSLDKLRLDFKKDWFPQFMKEYKSDLVGSLPRMFVGGVAMSGGPSIFFDENIPLEDKMFSIMLGGFMMRRGHELSTRRVTQNSEGKNSITFVEPTGFFGGKKPTSYGKNFEEMQSQIRMMGGNPWTWGGYRDLINGRGSSLMDIQDKLPVGDTEFGKKIKGVLEDTVTPAGKSYITTEKDLKVFERKKGDPPVEVEATYGMYIQAARNLVPVETNIKGWDNLSSAGKKAVEKQLKDKDFRTPEDVLEARTSDNLEIMIVGDAVKIDGFSDALTHIGLNRAPDSNGVRTFPKLEPQGAHESRTLEAIANYNAHLNNLEISGKIKIDVTEEIGSPRKIITPNTKGLDKFVSEVQNVHEKYSNLFGFGKETGYEIFPDDRTFVDLIKIKTFFENKSKAKEVMDLITSSDKIGTEDVIRNDRLDRARTLFTQVFQKDGMMRGYIDLKGNKDWRNQNFVNNLGQIARLELGLKDRTTADRGKKDTSVDVEAVKQLREIFRAEGLNLFEKSGRETDIFLAQYRQQAKKDMIFGAGKLGKDGKRKDVTEEDLSTTLALTETGFLNDNLTMARWGKFEDSFSQLANKTSKSLHDMFVGGKKADISALVKDMKAVGDKQGIDTSTITDKNMQKMAEAFQEYTNNMVESPSYPDVKTKADAVSHLKGDINYIFKTIENRVKPLIQTVKNGERVGFIKMNNKDIVHFTPEGVLSLKNHMLAIDKTRQSTDMDTFIKQLSEATIDPSKRMKSFSNYLLGQMARQSWKSTDSIKIMELASAHRIWNPIERKFETESMSETSLNNAIRKVMRGFTRGHSESNQMVESIMKRLERESREDGQGENSYSSMTYAELIKKYDFSEYEFAPGHTDGLLDRQIDIKGGVEPADVQLQNIYNKYYGYDKRVEFGNALIDAATSTKNEKGAKRYKGDPDLIIRDVSKVILDQANTVTVPILNYNESRTTPGMTANASNVMKVNDTYSAIERATGGIPLETTNIAIIPEKFLGTVTKSVKDPATGQWIKKLSPTWKSLTHSETVSGSKEKIFPNEDLINRQLFEIDKLVFDESFKRKHDGTPLHESIPKATLYMPYAQTWGYAVPWNPKGQAETFVKLLKTHKADPKLAKEWLKELFIQVDRNGEVSVNETNLGDAKSAMSWTKGLMDRSLGLDMFGKNYIDNKLYTMEGVELGGLLRRGVLFSSGNSNELRTDVLNDIAAIYSRPDASTTLRRHAKEFQDLISGKKKRVVIQDEIQQDTFDILHEHKQEVENVYGEMSKAGKEGSDKFKAIQRYLKDVEGLERFLKGAPSSQDAGTIVEPQHFDALASLYGATRSMDIGGIKVIMLRAGDNFYVNKTALTKNSQYTEFWKNNPDVAQLSFTSGNKKIGGKYYGEMADGVNEVSTGWESSTDLKRQTLRPEDYKISFIKANKNKATIAPNTFTFAHGMEQVVYDYYFKPNVNKNISDLAKMHKVSMFEEAIAKNKFWTDKSMESASESWAQDSPLSLEMHLAEANMIPYLHQHHSSWSRNIKTQMIDPLLRPRINGGQIVHQGVAPNENVRNSVHYYDEGSQRMRIHRLGEFNAPSTIRNVGFDKDNVFFVKIKDVKDPTSDTGKDLISFSELRNTEGLKTYEMQSIQTENGIFNVHTKHKTGDVTRYGTVRSIKNIEKKGEWWESKDIGELNDRIPDGYQVFVFGKRDPFVGGDSIIPMLLKREFKSAQDGNSGSMNKMDGQLSAELDNDIDIVNVWWNGPRKFASHTIERKGEVPWGTKPTENSTSSMEGLKPFDVNSATNYRGLLSEAAALKGKLMNYQSVLDWLWKHNSGQMLAEGEAQTFHVGKNLFASIPNSPLERQQIKQKLRNDIQGIVDGTGGFDKAYYAKWERDFLFEGDSPVFKAAIMKNGEFKGLQGNITHQVSQNIIMDNLISPYRRLRSLSNSMWEGTKSKKHNFDEFIAGIRKYDSELTYASQRASKQLKKVGEEIANPFHGWNYDARLFGKRSSADYEKMLPYDRLIASMAGMDYRNMMDSPPSGTRNSYEYADITEGLLNTKSSTDFAKVWGREFRNWQDGQFYIKNLQKQMYSYNKLAGKVFGDNPKMARDLRNKAKAIQRNIINKHYRSSTFKYEINDKGKAIEQRYNYKTKEWENASKPDKQFKILYDSVKNHWREKLLAEALKGLKGEKRAEASYKWHEKNNTYGVKGKGKPSKDNLVTKKIRDKGLVVEATPDHEMISAISAHEAFGLLAHNKPYEYTTNMSHVKATHQQIVQDAQRIGSNYSRDWRNWHEGNSPNFNEKQIEQHYMSELSSKYKELHDTGGTELANQLLWQLMTPKFDTSKLVMSGDKTYFAPSEKSWASRLNLGLRFVARTDLILPETKKIIFADYAAGNNRTFLSFHHHRGQNDLFMSSSDIMVRNEQTGALERRTKDGLMDIRNQFKLNPLSYSKHGTMEEVLHEVHPGFEGQSATMSYKQMLEMFGSGGIPQILSKHRAFYMPEAAITDASRFGPHMAISGYPAFLKAKRMGINAYLQGERSRSTLDPEGTFERMKPLDEGRRRKNLEEEMYENYSQIVCNQGNGKL